MLKLTRARHNAHGVKVLEGDVHVAKVHIVCVWRSAPRTAYGDTTWLTHVQLSTGNSLVVAESETKILGMLGA